MSGVKRTFFTKRYLKAYQALSPKQQDRIDATLKEFTEDPHAPALRNHPLHGKLKGWRSISAGGNLRILFECDDAYEIVTFINVGTHTKVY